MLAVVLARVEASRVLIVSHLEDQKNGIASAGHE
jgi:hypothetical protein